MDLSELPSCSRSRTALAWVFEALTDFADEVSAFVADASARDKELSPDTIVLLDAIQKNLARADQALGAAIFAYQPASGQIN